MSDIARIHSRVSAMRARHADRDRRMANVQAIRRGKAAQVAPDLFSDEWSESIVANMIDTAARDVAAVLAPLPSFSCSASSGLSESAKAFADKRTKVVRHYVTYSELEHQMNNRGADSYNTYGLLVLAVEPDFEHSCPRITVQDSIGAYPVWDKRGRTVEFARVTMRDYFTLAADYPQVEYARMGKPFAVQNGYVEVVEYVDRAGRVVVYSPQLDLILEDFSNGIGRCHIVAAQRPGLDDEIRGAYDDVVWVQLARHRLQMLLMEGIDKAVRAPLVMPPDANDVPLGPDAIIQTQHGVGSVGRARLDMPPQAFSAVEQLKQEQMVGSMSPEVRSGNMDASVITGRGVQQLMVGFSAQIAQAQTVFKWAFHRAIELCFEMDEKLFGQVRKELRGNDYGVPYSTTYVPEKDIAGDHTVEITYGFAAGLDPNRALVFLLQADGAGLVSKDYVRRALPVDLDAAGEDKKIVIEQSRMALVAAFSALAQSVPQLVAAGQDVSKIIAQQAEFIKLVQKGASVEEAVTKVLAPPEPPPAPPGAPPGPEQGGPGGPAGFQDNGLPSGLTAGAVTQGPGGRPSLQQMFAGLTGSGNPNLSAVVSRMKPVGT